jgi:L-arabinose isomerase
MIPSIHSSASGSDSLNILSKYFFEEDFKMAVKPKVGVLVMALLEDDYNKTAHMRPLAQKAADHIGDIIAQYGEAIRPPLVEEESQAETAAQMFNSAGVDLIVAVELAYTKGIVPTRCFLNTTAPVVVWNTQSIRYLPEDADFDLIMVNSGMAGVPEMTSALLRIDRPFWMITSHIDDPTGRQKLAEYINAAGVIRRLKETRIGIIGHAFEGMTDLMVDQLNLRQFIGPVCWPLEPEKVAVAMQELSQDEVNVLANMERDRYHVEMEPAVFDRSCRLALALEKVARKYSFNALATFDQIWLTDPRVGIIPSYGTGRLCEIGIPCSTEADITTLTAMLILQGLAGAATFLENYVIDFDRDAMILSHDGHGNPALAARPSDVSIKHSIYYQGVNGFGAGLEFAYAPGPVTNLALVNLGGNHWRLNIAEGESLAITPRPVAAPQMLFKPRHLNISDWCNAWCMAGSPHHMALAYGHLANKIKVYAKLAGIEVVEI